MKMIFSELNPHTNKGHCVGCFIRRKKLKTKIKKSRLEK
jgi:hypothetical protein